MLYLRKTVTGLALKLFRGEPAISGFDWNFSPIHTSSPPFQQMCVRTYIAFYGNFILDMDRSPGFGSMAGDFIVLFTLAFASAPYLKYLTLPHAITRRTVLQKVRRRTFIVLRQLVNTGFQVLFHSPPGVLFTFPSQYYALSVTE